MKGVSNDKQNQKRQSPLFASLLSKKNEYPVDLHKTRLIQNIETDYSSNVQQNKMRGKTTGYLHRKIKTDQHHPRQS